MAGHYFTTPDDDQPPQFAEVTLEGRSRRLATGPGVFSGRGLDPGTAVLLRAVPDPPQQGNLLDLGCGWGPIALALALRAPRATVWAVDVNRRALDLTAGNAATMGLRLNTALPEDVPGDVRFDVIWSNPAIRIGKPALHAMLETWLALLSDEGVAYLVVQKNLGADSLQSWLSDRGYPTTRWASSKGFRVLRTTAVTACGDGGDAPGPPRA